MSSSWPPKTIAVDLRAGTVAGVPVQWRRIDDDEVCPSPDRSHSIVQATDAQVLIALSSGRVLVNDTPLVVIELAEGKTRNDLAFALYGWVPSMVSMFAGTYFLHASCVTSGAATVAVCGWPGSGKSSICAGLTVLGRALCADDTTPVVHRADGPWIVPYQRPIHLDPRDAANIAGLPRLDHPLAKHYKHPYAAKLDTQPRPLDAIVVVVPSSEVAQVELSEPLAGPQAIAQLIPHLHQNVAAFTPARAASALEWLRNLAQLPVYVLRRPRDIDSRNSAIAAVDSIVIAMGRGRRWR